MKIHQSSVRSAAWLTLAVLIAQTMPVLAQAPSTPRGTTTPRSGSPTTPGSRSSRAPTSTPSPTPSPSTVAFAASASAPNMIGDFFGGVGACGTPVFLGRSVFHSANTTFGDNDFHLIAPGDP